MVLLVYRTHRLVTLPVEILSGMVVAMVVEDRVVERAVERVDIQAMAVTVLIPLSRQMENLAKEEEVVVEASI